MYVVVNSKNYRYFLSSTEAVSLWTEWIRRHWPSSSLVDGRNLVDLLQMPIAVCSSQEVNFGVLLGHAARHQPTGVDKSLLVAPPPSTRRLRTSRHVTTPSLTISQDSLRGRADQEGRAPIVHSGGRPQMGRYGARILENRLGLARSGG